MLKITLMGTTAGLALMVATSASANDSACENRVNNNVEKLLECVTVAGVQKHQQAFQDI